MSMLGRRLQVLIDEERYDRLATAARRRGVSVAAVVREAIDRDLETLAMGRAQAAHSFLAAQPMDVGDVNDLLQELDDLRARRA